MKTGFIPPGYIADGFIRASEHHPALTFKYHPATLTERRRLEGRVALFEKTMQHADGERAAAKFVADHIVEWDVTHPTSGQPMPVSAAVVERMEPHLSERLYRVVVGVSLSDEPNS